MTFHSILFERPEDSINDETVEEPAFFVDVNLDQIINAITAGRQEYNLKPFFHTSLKTVDSVKYRHEIIADLHNRILFEHITLFARQIRDMREYLTLAGKLSHQYQKAKWFLDAVELYCDAVNSLVQKLSLVEIQSRGLLAFREYLTIYASAERFISLLEQTKKLQAALSTVKYCVLIKSYGLKVRKYESESDYSAEVEETFAKFKQGAVKDYKVKSSTLAVMNHVEEKVLDFVAKLYPDIFSDVDTYCANNRNYLDKTIAVFDREIQFYVAYLEYAEMFKRNGLKFCYPTISTKCKEVYDYEGFDLALAYKLMREGGSIVCNDFYLKNEERIMVVSGPNQGGKTTFARTFGQLHYLASLGCPVPGREAQLYLFDRIFTHFEKEENINNLRGKLQDDLVRIHDILNHAIGLFII
jgi:DNA mismatch repair protein MutS